MLWIDKDFDYNDQLAKKYLKYHDEYYDKGTVLKIQGHTGPVLVRFKGWGSYQDRFNFERMDGKHGGLWDSYNRAGPNAYVVEIVRPIYPPPEELVVELADTRNKPPEWDVQVGWIWYIVVMVVAMIFKNCLAIWVFATIVFFLWKNGFLNGGKK